MEHSERRANIRVKKSSRFVFKRAESDSTSQEKEGVMIDYSVAGIRFETDEQLSKNTSLVIELDLDSLNDEIVDWRRLWGTGDVASLQVVGSVMWCLQSKSNPSVYEVGTRFTNKA